MIQLHRKKRQICFIVQMNILILILLGSSVSADTETPIINHHWYSVGEHCLPNTDWQLIVSDFNKPVQCPIITDTTMVTDGGDHSHLTIIQHRRTGTLNQWILIIREICSCRRSSQNRCCHYHHQQCPSCRDYDHFKMVLVTLRVTEFGLESQATEAKYALDTDIDLTDENVVNDLWSEGIRFEVASTFSMRGFCINEITINEGCNHMTDAPTIIKDTPTTTENLCTDVICDTPECYGESVCIGGKCFHGSIFPNGNECIGNGICFNAVCIPPTIPETLTTINMALSSETPITTTETPITTTETPTTTTETPIILAEAPTSRIEVSAITNSNITVNHHTMLILILVVSSCIIITIIYKIKTKNNNNNEVELTDIPNNPVYNDSGETYYERSTMEEPSTMNDTVIPSAPPPYSNIENNMYINPNYGSLSCSFV